MRSAVLQYTNESPMAYVWRMAEVWRKSEGRFFPVSAIENVYMFHLIHDRVTFKILQMISVLSVALLASLVMRGFGLSRLWQIFTPIVVLIVIQVQMWFDATMGFGLLLQSVMIKFLFVTWLVTKMCQTKDSRVATACWLLTFVTWTLAVFQYEVVVFVWPVLVFAVALLPASRLRRLTAVGATAIPTAISVVTALVLRSGVTASDGYTISLFTTGFWRAFAQQLVAAIPLSSIVFLNQSGWSTRSWVVSALVFSAIVIGMSRLYQQVANRHRRSTLIVISFGLGLAIFPAVPVAMSLRWQNQLSWGHGYLAVFIQYVGVAFLLVGLIAVLIQATCAKGVASRYICTGVVALVLAGIGGSHAAGIESVVNGVEPITWRRELFEEAVRDGFFDEVPPNASIISASYNPNGWFSPWYYAWLGGNRSHLLSGTTNGMVASCTEAVNEGRCMLTGPWWGFAEFLSDSRYTVGVLGLYTRLDVDPMSTEMVSGSIKVVGNNQQDLPPECRRSLRQTRSGNWTGSCVREVTTLGQVLALLSPVD